MRQNAAKAAWKDGRVTHGAWLSNPSSVSAEAMAHQGFDWLCVDMQHGLIDYQVALTMIQAINSTPTVPFVRVPWNEFGIIGKMLDAGALGVIIPMVNTVAEAEAAVAACRYFPDGARSFGPTRLGYAYGADYYAHANEEVACIPMIETTRALDRLDDILALPGIDAVYVGPADLSITLGQQPRMDNDGAFEQARVRIADACNARGITAGIHANAQLAEKHAAAGFRMITVSGDLGAMTQQAAADLKLARGAPTAGAQPVYR